MFRMLSTGFTGVQDPLSVIKNLQLSTLRASSIAEMVWRTMLADPAPADRQALGECGMAVNALFNLFA